MTTPASAVPTLDEFREAVGGNPANDGKLQRILDKAVTLVDDFCREPMRPIPDHMLTDWYIQVGAEIHDQAQGPSQYTDRFENVVSARSSRDPLIVVMREMRRYVSFI